MSKSESIALSTLIEALSDDMRDTGAASAEISFDNYKHMVHVTIKVSELNND